jgi:hypothetical protein
MMQKMRRRLLDKKKQVDGRNDYQKTAAMLSSRTFTNESPPIEDYLQSGLNVINPSIAIVKPVIEPLLYPNGSIQLVRTGYTLVTGGPDQLALNLLTQTATKTLTKEFLNKKQGFPDNNNGQRRRGLPLFKKRFILE